MDEGAAPQLIDPNLNEVQNDFLDQQAQALLGLADETLVQHPPGLPEPSGRRLVLHLLDGVLHDVYAPQRPPVREFFHRRIRRAAEQIENTTGRLALHPIEVLAAALA